MRSRNLALVRSLIVLVFIVVVAVILLPSALERINPPAVQQVTCYVGSEKSGFLDNPQVKDILSRDYGLEVSYTKMGSIEQAYVDSSQVDCLWPSNTSALEIYRDAHKQDFDTGSISYETIFNSPIVLYSWGPLVDELSQQGLFTPVDDHYTVDTARLVRLLTETPATSWQSLNVSGLYGSFNVITTDPTRSNSGNMFYGLFANMLAGGQVATLDALTGELPTIKAYFDNQGYMEESSGVLFDRFINTGMGANPIIANYESLLIEFSVAHQDSLDMIHDEIRIIYPTPTVWSAHPLIARTATGKQLIEALHDERLQQIAWEQHGFRSGLIGVQNDPAVLQIAGIPAEVASVMPLPRADAMIEMLDYLKN
ncbi:MAG: substrate-binding domain-containing protein [Anaerolineae bacterium]|nr:substrate-binding domain-containing protein [Anaerolineae bacterium]